MSTRTINNVLVHFLLRTSMYVHDLTKPSITSFVSGYIVGSGKTDFTEKIKSYLENEYNIYGSSGGWPHQIDQYSKAKGIPWVSGFKQVGLNVLISNSRNIPKDDFNIVIKEMVINSVAYINEDRFGLYWIKNWFGLVNLNEQWFLEEWTDDELGKLKEIDKELREIYLLDSENLTITNNLKIAKYEFEKILNLPAN